MLLAGGARHGHGHAIADMPMIAMIVVCFTSSKLLTQVWTISNKNINIISSNNNTNTSKSCCLEIAFALLIIIVVIIIIFMSNS